MEQDSQSAKPHTGTTPASAGVHLTVLPHSGKVDELRREMQADAQPQATASSGPAVTSTAPAAREEPAPKTIAQKLVEGKIIAALREIYDPEIPVNIYDLGLIYEIDVAPDNVVKVKMTITAPACPVAGTLPGEVETKVETVEEVKSASVELVWDPPWSKDRMSEAAMLQLGFF